MVSWMTHLLTYSHTHILTCAHVLTYTHTHTHTYSHTHILTYSRSMYTSVYMHRLIDVIYQTQVWVNKAMFNFKPTSGTNPEKSHCQ